MEVVNLGQKVSRFADYWSPKIVGEVNDMHVKLVKLQGEFVWHHHDVRMSCSSWSRGASGCSDATATGTSGRGSSSSCPAAPSTVRSR